ncbi:MAG: glycosyltransferase family 2 protein [Candidatus Omnitrophota bacterium]
MIPLSVVVVTKNEEKNMDFCLGSVSGWADEIVVVDDQSTDRTVELAKKYTDKIYHRKMDVEGRHRNWAYAQASNEWVLSLDADEMVTEELKLEIASAIVSDQFQAYSIPLKNYIGSYWVKHGGWYPAGKLRLFQKSKFKYEEVGVHPRAFLEGVCGHLTKDIVHKGYPDLAHFLGSLNYQTTGEAEKWINDGRKMSLLRAWRKGVTRFIKGYFMKKGYKDGMHGLIVAYFALLYQLMSYFKYWQMNYEKSKK